MKKWSSFQDQQLLTENFRSWVNEDIDLGVSLDRTRFPKFMKSIDDVSNSIEQMDPGALNPNKTLRLMTRMKDYFEKLLESIVLDEPLYNSESGEWAYGYPSKKWQHVTSAMNSLGRFIQEAHFTMYDYENNGISPCSNGLLSPHNESDCLTYNDFRRSRMMIAVPDAEGGHQMVRHAVGLKTKKKFKEMWEAVVGDLDNAMNVLDDNSEDKK